LLEPAGADLKARLGSGTCGPVPADAFTLLAIPGLGQVPVRTFFFLILVFVVLVGPINFLVLKRRRRPMALLVTVPAIGFGFTAVILLYGVFSEGLGVQGVRRAFTLLDQRSHRSASCAQQTLYAGLGPGRLELIPEAGLFSSDHVFYGRRRLTSELNLNLNGGQWLEPGILPSRIATNLCTVAVGRERARLQFQRQGEGWQAQHDGRFAPVAGSDLVLRDMNGDYFAGRADGVLTKLSAAAAQRRVRELLRTSWQLESMADQNQPGAYGEWPTTNLPDWLERQLGSELPAAGDLALMQGAPSEAIIGMEVKCHVDHQVVIGRLAPEDLR
jgi:hypothetical protein